MEIVKIMYKKSRLDKLAHHDIQSLKNAPSIPLQKLKQSLVSYEKNQVSM
jgi:hypothetical protein